MIKKAKRKGIALPCILLVCFTLFFAFAGCSSAPEEPSGETSTETKPGDGTTSPGTSETPSDPGTQNELLALTRDGKALCCIVFETGDVTSSETASKLCKELAQKTDDTVEFTKCGSANFAKTEAFDFVITLGSIPGISDDLYTVSLRVDDSAVVRSGRRIALLGRNSEALLRARKMLTGALTQRDGVLYLDTGIFETPRVGDYLIKQLTAGDVSIAEYVIVTSERDTYRGEQLRDLIAKFSGYILPVVTDGSPAARYELVVGNTSRDGMADIARGAYRITREGDRISFAFDGTSSTWETMMLAVEKQLQSASYGGTYQMEQLLTEKNATSTIRILSMNVLNVWTKTSSAGTRDDAVADLILAEKPDFVCLQEFDTSYRNSPNGLASLIGDLYDEAAPWGVETCDIWNPVFYRKDLYTVEACGMLNFSDYVNCTEYHYYDGTSDGDTKLRTMVWAVLKSRTDGQTYLVGNLHYSLIVPAGTVTSNATHDTYDHSLESNLVIAEVKKLSSQYGNCPTLICGDYNSTVSNTIGGAYNMLKNGFKDTYSMTNVRSDSDTWHEVGQRPTGTYGGAIDHIFSLSQLNVESYMILTDPSLLNASDHCPTLVSFTVPEGGGVLDVKTDDSDCAPPSVEWKN